MVDDLREFKLERERSNDFEQVILKLFLTCLTNCLKNGSVTNYSALLQENNSLKSKISKVNKELKQNERFKEQIGKMRKTSMIGFVLFLVFRKTGDCRRYIM
jgi:hypothetical protein